MMKLLVLSLLRLPQEHLLLRERLLHQRVKLILKPLASPQLKRKMRMKRKRNWISQSPWSTSLYKLTLNSTLARLSRIFTYNSCPSLSASISDLLSTAL
jgi:hypothetical protein